MAQAITTPTVRLTVEIDDDPDLSFIGTFQDAPGPADRTIDRREKGTMGQNEHRYFVAANSAEQTGNPDSVAQDWERAEAYGTEWVMVGVRAVATLTVAGTTQTLRSGGVWGVENDAGPDHLTFLAGEELSELHAILTGMGLDVGNTLTAEWADDAPAPVSGTVSVRIERD